VHTPLPRRAWLAVELPGDELAFTPAGLTVAAVIVDGMATRAGVQDGDIITSVAGLPVRTLAELRAALRRAGGSPTTQIEYARSGEPLARIVEVTHAPIEQLEGIDLVYGELPVAGSRLRTIATHTATPRAAVFVIQGIACESIDGSDAPLVELVHGWARAGFDTFRVDKQGVGDSEGGPCNELDFATELAGFEAALSAAQARARALAIPLVVFGHSVGAIIAAHLAPGRGLAGCITYGAPTSRWLACVVDTTRRQLALHGEPPEELERSATALAERAITSGINGRSGAYHRQLDAIDPAALWARVHVPVLVVRGEHDWVVRADDQARIAQLAPCSTLVDLPGLDHLLGWHPDQAASLRDYGAGRFDPAIIAATVEWIGRLC